jgi:hypothetical protein
MNRLRRGWCRVPNPFHSKQVSEVSLAPKDVDVIVFWTRNAFPIFPYLRELEEAGYRSCFLYTLVGNPRLIDPGCPPIEDALRTFQTLAERIGPEKVIWRYDPVVITSVTDPDYHMRAFRRIAGELRGSTTRCIVSNVHIYRKAEKRFREKGIVVKTLEEESLGDLMRFMAGEAQEQGMEIQSCAQTMELECYGVRPGKCVDDEYIGKVFGIEVSDNKDPSQRKTCRCVRSKDIGMYNTCLHRCLYCYATGSFEKAQENYRRHDPAGPCLIPLP